MNKRYLQLPVARVCWAILVLGLTNASYAQRTVNVDEGFGTLNIAIDGDTTATGARVDSNTVYVLKRGGIYLLDGTLENIGYPLTVVAEEGEGDRPRLIPAVAAGGESDRPFTPKGDLTLKGLYVTSEDELGGLNKRIIRMKADDLRIVVDDCHLDKARQAAFSFDNENVRAFVTNSIVSNIRFDWNKGRGFDDRGNNIDTLFVQNSTFYNLASRVLRGAGGFIKYAKFNHNTMVNVGRWVAKFEEAVELEYTNNLMVNCGVLGQDTLTVKSLVMLDPLTNTFLVDTLGLTQKATISNNNFYNDPVFQDVYPDTVFSLPFFDSTAVSYIDQAGTGATNTDEAIVFTSSPIPNTDDVVDWYATGQDNDTSVPDLDISGEPFDFAYPNTTAAFTASTAGQPLGDLHWFGLDIITSINDFNGGDDKLPRSFELLGNYPNPFNPTTNIRYTLPTAAQVKLTIFNVIGQKIRTLVDAKNRTAGVHTAEWDARDDSGKIVTSGVYFYRLETVGGFVQTNKMLLLK